MSGHQPHYLPSVSYFAKIVASDRFVFSDDVQFVRKDWQHRNRIAWASESGWEYLSLPVERSGSLGPIAAKKVCAGSWGEEHARMIERAYGDCAHFESIAWLPDRLRQLAEHDVLLADLNVLLTVEFLRCLGIERSWYRATELPPYCRAPTQASIKIANQVRRLECDAYLSGPSGPDYLDRSAFQGYPIYLFRWQGDRSKDLSIVDVLARHGEESRDFLGQWTLERWA